MGTSDIIWPIPGVYEIKSPSGRRYVGSTSNLKNRANGHRVKLLAGDHHNGGLQGAADKYGIDSLLFEVLSYTTSSREALKLEQEEIDKARWCGEKLYNIALDVTKPTSGRGEDISARIRANPEEHATKTAQCLQFGVDRLAPVVCQGLLGQRFRFDSGKAAAEKIGGLRSKICLCCAGKRRVHRDLVWAYADETEKLNERAKAIWGDLARMHG